MLPEAILQSDVLDILFENRNKTYGAYILRRQYNGRLAKAIMSVALFALVAALLLCNNKASGTKKQMTAPVFDTVTLLLVPPVKPQPEKKQQTRATQPVKPLPQVKFTDKVEIVKTPVTDTIPTVKALEENNIGGKNVAGDVAAAGIGQRGDNSGNTGLAEAKPGVVDDDKPVENADIMPQFPGGNEAFQKFMQRNLKQPDDLDAGEKIVVLVRFIVEKDGSITSAELINSGRRDLDENVLKTLLKMPHWVPGLQKGRRVAVYFKLPVTFVQQEQ